MGLPVLRRGSRCRSRCCSWWTTIGGCWTRWPRISGRASAMTAASWGSHRPCRRWPRGRYAEERSEEVAVVIADHDMAEVSGLEFLARAHQLVSGPETGAPGRQGLTPPTNPIVGANGTRQDRLSPDQAVVRAAGVRSTRWSTEAWWSRLRSQEPLFHDVPHRRRQSVPSRIRTCSPRTGTTYAFLPDDSDELDGRPEVGRSDRRAGGGAQLQAGSGRPAEPAAGLRPAEANL